MMHNPILYLMRNLGQFMVMLNLFKMNDRRTRLFYDSRKSGGYLGVLFKILMMTASAFRFLVVNLRLLIYLCRNILFFFGLELLSLELFSFSSEFLEDEGVIAMFVDLLSDMLSYFLSL